MDETAALRRTSLLEHFAEIKDTRQPCKVMYPLGEVLLLVVCGTMAACDDYDDIVLWGNKHLDFLRCSPRVSSTSWPSACRPCVGQIVIAGKASRRSHGRGRGQAASGALAGSLVAIDAMGRQPDIAEKIVDCGGDYLLATRDNQKTAHAEIELYFDGAPETGIDTLASVEKAHGRLETRIEAGGETTVERRCHVASRALTAEAFAQAARAHWAMENGLHWVLDVQFREDQSRLRRGHGARNMAIVRHFALNLIRAMPGKKAIKGKRKLAARDTGYLLTALTLNPR